MIVIVVVQKTYPELQHTESGIAGGSPVGSERSPNSSGVPILPNLQPIGDIILTVGDMSSSDR